MANKPTQGMWFNPIVLDDEPDAVKLEDVPLTNTAAITNNAIYPLDAYNKSPQHFHRKIDQAYGQFCLKFNINQQQYLSQIQQIIRAGDCFSAFTQIFPSTNLTQFMQMMLHAGKRQTWALFHMYEINFSIFRNAAPRAQRKAFYILVNHTGNELQGLLTSTQIIWHSSLTARIYHDQLVLSKQQGTSVPTSR
ncbi:hypothetical protein FACUT_394 [Fusarium acutatum]|uniref:Uncharacterized protein n=1 Tax=Fusarium acutatum TaxID=78861 RepID=A0A8H4K7H6_9HYPO|nr:hypothetical protein FACUT_394 [Fusarium acutatum]